MQEESNCPMYAKIGVTTSRYTYAYVHLFGRRVEHRFDGPGHRRAAIGWVNAWNEHLSSSFMVLRDVNAEVMSLFAQRLIEHGVPTATIEAALAEMQEIAHDSGA